MLTKEIIHAIYTQNLFQLIEKARKIHQQNFKDQIELCKLISIKTGGCTEDCSYCAQGTQNKSEIKVNPLLPLNEVLTIAANTKKNGVKRICMGGAYKAPNSRALAKAKEYIKAIKSLGLETCVTLGSLTLNQAQELKAAGLDYYNHNLDTSPEYYPEIVSTHSFQDRINTINNVARAGINVCSGGILGLGEELTDRISFIYALSQLETAPQSIPINTLVPIKGTPLENTPELDKIEIVRTIATLRIIFPSSRIRLSAGRKDFSELEQSLCFFAGANSIFYGEELLTTPNIKNHQDDTLLQKLGLTNA